MKIGVVTTSYPRWRGDAAGSFVAGHVRALVELGHEVEVIAAGDAHARSPGDIDARGGGDIDMRGTGDIDARGGGDIDMRGTLDIDIRGGGDIDMRGTGDIDMRGGEFDMRGTGDIGRLVELREAERRATERRDIDTGHLVDLREAERRASERREIDTSDLAEPHERRERAGREPLIEVVRVPSRGLFYRGGAPDAIERSPLRAMISAASFIPRFAATVAMRARRWDHVIAHWLAPSAIAAIPSTKPLTAIAHGGDIYTLRRMHLLAPTIAALRARGTRLVFVSEQLREIAKADGLVQPMGIDLAHFAALGRAPASPPIVLFAGRLVPIKGADTAIEAMLRLPHMQLVIAGDGFERRALEARAIANRSRGARITFVGEVDTARRDQWLRQASVVVVPSRTMQNGRAEGCPTIALEALASGVPVVSTIGRASEIVPPDSPAELAAAIDRVGRSRTKTTELVADLDWKSVAQRLLRND